MGNLEHNPTRRAALAALATVPMFAGTIGFNIAEAATTDRSGWYALRDDLDRASAIEDAYNREVHDPAWDAYSAVRPPKPDLTFREGELVYDFGRDPSLLYEEGRLFPPKVARDRVRPIYDAYQAAEAEAKERFQIAEIGERSDELADARFAIEKRLIEMPSPDLPALLWKIENLWGCSLDEGEDACDSVSMDWCRPVIEDARRLLSREA